MKKKPSKEEWEAVMLPFLRTFHKRSSRRKLCQLHRGPVAESKIQQPWATGETAFMTINAQSIKVCIIFQNGSTAFMEYDANGHQIQGIRQAPDGSITDRGYF